MNVAMQLFAMGIAIAAWVVSTTVLVGVGRIGCSLLRLSEALDDDWAGTAMLGICVWLPLAALTQFFVPLSLFIVGPPAAFGMIVGGLYWKRTCRFRRSPSIRFIAANVVMTVWLANHATAAAFSDDAKAYHLQALHWTIASRLAPGLANLHYRLGFPTLYYGFAALFEWWPSRGVASYFTNSTLFWITLSRGLRALSMPRSHRPMSTALLPDLFFAGTFPFVLLLASSVDVNNIALDAPSQMLILFAVAMSLRMRDASRDQAPSAGLSLIFAAGAMCVKLSSAGIAAGLLLTLIIQLLPLRRRIDLRPFVAATIFATTGVAVWLARTFILTGYFVFPASASSLGLAPRFAVPLRLVRYVNEETVHFGRFVRSQEIAVGLEHLPGFLGAIGHFVARELTRGHWIIPLAIVLPILGFTTHLVPLVIAGLLIVHGYRRPAPSVASAPIRWWPWMLPLIGGFALWLTTSPETRFSSHVAWAAAGLALAWHAERTGRVAPLRRVSVASGVAVTLVILLGFQTACLRIVRLSRDQAFLWLWSPPAAGGCPPTPAARITQDFRTHSGLIVPIADDGYVGWRPLLSSHLLEAELALRNPSDLSAGFYMMKPEAVTVPPRHATPPPGISQRINPQNPAVMNREPTR